VVQDARGTPSAPFPALRTSSLTHSPGDNLFYGNHGISVKGRRLDFPSSNPGASFAFKAAGGFQGLFSAFFFKISSSIRLTNSLILKGFVK